MKKIRLQVACRYLSIYGGELEGERGHLTMSGYIGTPPQKIIPYFGKVDIFLKDAQHNRIAVVTTGLPTKSGHLYARTGEFKPEIPY